ncbi:MurR/RpiR family transcriptional regulator [Demequina pelophila]|uniref:MurR/RpiR family transcriptional regulator n=1 Tax=Demequina pelophila TaxID=1638984 RepID=UPI000780FACE|nr:MurR/RpiR family transcriptional regulator [Demequina pelophila]
MNNDARRPHDLGSLRASLQARLPALRASDARVIQLVLDDPEFVRDARTAEVADRAQVSPATVVRASRAAGFEGFAELRLALHRATALRPDDHTPLAVTDSRTTADIQNAILGSHAESVAAIRGTLDIDALERAIQAISDADKVLLAGTSTSHATAVDAVFRFRSVGLVVGMSRDDVSQQIQARLLGTKDVALVISHSGRTATSLQVARAAREVGAHVIAITSYVESPLTELATISLVAGGADPGLEMTPSSSRIAHLTIVDMLHAGVALADMERTRKASAITAEVLGY